MMNSVRLRKLHIKFCHVLHTLLKGNCNQNLHLVFIDLIQSTTSITIDTQVLL